MKKLALIAGVAALAVIAVVLIRTALHQPRSTNEVPVVEVSIDEARATAMLSESIRFRTISHQDTSRLDEAEFEAFIAWFTNAYADVIEAVPLERVARYTLLLRWQGSNPELAPVLLTGHYDVVPVIPGSEVLWKHPPYSRAVEQGVVWGRGALDDKGGVIAQMEAVRHLLSQGFAPERTIYLSFGHDEEVGGSGAAAVASVLRQRGVELEWSLDEGSFLFDGLLPGLEIPFAAINVAEKGSITLDIVARGAGGHSSMPPRQGAVSRLAHAIARLEAEPLEGGLTGLSEAMFDTASRHMSFGYRVPFANRWLFDGVLDDQLSAVTFGNAMLRTTIAPTMLSGSIKSNVLPTEAVATVNFRIHPRDTPELVVEHVRSVVETEYVSVRLPHGDGSAASGVSSWEVDGYDHIAQAVREVYGEVAVAPGLMIAASDTRHYGKVAKNAYRFNPMIVTSEDLTGFHGTNEKISVSSFAQGIRTYVRILRLSAGG